MPGTLQVNSIDDVSDYSAGVVWVIVYYCYRTLSAPLRRKLGPAFCVLA